MNRFNLYGIKSESSFIFRIRFFRIRLNTFKLEVDRKDEGGVCDIVNQDS